MADLTKTIDILFTATDKTAGAFQSVGQGLGDLASNAQTITQPIANVTKSLLAVEGAVAAVGIGMAAYAFGEAVDFESAMLDLEKVMSDGEGSAFDYQTAIQELASDFGVMSTEVVNSAVNFKQAGFSIDESLGLVEQSLIAVKTADLDAATASQLLVATLKGFGAEASEAARVLDVWNSVSNNFGTSAAELAQGMAALSPIARAAGLSFEETAGLLTPVIEVFGSGAEPANALKTGLLRLADPAKEAADQMTAMGIATKDSEGNLYGVDVILGQLAHSWEDYTGEQKLATASIIFGKNQAGRMSQVLEEYSRSLDVTAVAQGGAGASAEELAVRLGSAEFAIEQLGVAFNSAAITIGTKYKDETKQVVQSTTELISSFEAVVAEGGLKPLFDLMRPLLEEFAINISKMAQSLPEAFEGLEFDRLIDSFERLAGSVSELFGDVDLTTADGLRRALQGIVDIGASLVSTTSGIVSAFEPFVDLIVELVDNFDNSNDSAENFGEAILGLGTVLNIAFGFLGSFAAALNALGSSIIILNSAKGIGTFAVSLDAAGAAMARLSAVLSTGILPALAALGTAFGAGFGIGTFVNEVTGASDALVDWIAELSGLDDAANDAIKPITFTTEQLARQKTAIEGAAEATKKLKEAQDPASEAAIAAAEARGKLLDVVREEGQVLGDTGLVWDAATATFIKAKDATDELAAAARSTDVAVDSMGNAIKGGSGALSIIKNESEKVVTELKNINDETDKVKIAMLELASEERIKSIELAVDLKVATVEADAKKVVAAYDSIAQTITSTNELVGKLSTSEAPEWDKFGFNLKKQIKDAEKRAKEAHKSQQDLINAQTKNLQEQTKRIQDGEALIKIDSNGLEPHLDAFMWQILDKVRVRMAENYQDFLLGNSCSGGTVP